MIIISRRNKNKSQKVQTREFLKDGLYLSYILSACQTVVDRFVRTNGKKLQKISK